MTACRIASRAVLATAFSLSFVTVAHADIFKCAGARGRPVFQDSPCDGSVKRSATPEPQAAPVPTSGAGEATPEDRRITGLLESYQKCTHALPALGYGIAMDYQRWRSEHAATLARLERDPSFQAAMSEAAGEGDRTRGKLSEPQRQATAASCGVLEYAFAPPARTLAEVKAEMDRDAPAACVELQREYRLAHLDRASLEYRLAQRDAEERARVGPDERHERLERKLASLPAREQEDARAYRESLRAQCAKREGLDDYKPASAAR